MFLLELVVNVGLLYAAKLSYLRGKSKILDVTLKQSNRILSFDTETCITNIYDTYTVHVENDSVSLPFYRRLRSV